MAFQDKLKKLRIDKGITQEELASAIFVSRTLISKYESGSVYPTKENAEKLALYFNVKLSDLIGEDETVQIVLKQNDVSTKINKILSIIIIIIAFLFLLFAFLPIISVKFYDYSNGTPPAVRLQNFSAIQLTLKNSNPIVIFDIITLLANVVLSILTIKFNKNPWLKLANYILFVINLFLIFFTIIFSAAYASNNLYDYAQ